MRILYLHQYFCPPGGSGNNRSYELAKQWVQNGHSVTLVTSQAYFPADKIPTFHNRIARMEVSGIKVMVVDTPYAHIMPFRQRVKAFLQFYRRAGKALKEIEKFDLIYASSTPLTVGELGRKAAARMGIPYIFETVDVWPDVPIGMGILRNQALIKWLNKRTHLIYSEAKGIVALSEGMRDQVLSHAVPPQKVHVIHNGTHPEAIPFVERIPKDKITVLYAGTVGIANGVDELLKAAKYIEKLGRKDIEFTILGAGNDLDRVKRLAAEWKVGNVTFAARVPKEEVPELLAKADIGAVCFAPHKVLEANSANKWYDYLASGLPVVTNYQGWQATYMADYGCGLSCEQGDAVAYAENILKLANQPQLRKQMAVMGRQLVKERFDRRQLADKLIELFQSVCQNS